MQGSLELFGITSIHVRALCQQLSDRILVAAARRFPELLDARLAVVEKRVGARSIRGFSVCVDVSDVISLPLGC
jgi:hypothetical protein